MAGGVHVAVPLTVTLPPPAQVRGYGLSADAHHVTHPHPRGGGALLCMRRALAGSGVAARQLSYVNAHATSTPAGEVVGMLRGLGPRATSGLERCIDPM